MCHNPGKCSSPWVKLSYLSTVHVRMHICTGRGALSQPSSDKGVSLRTWVEILSEVKIVRKAEISFHQ